MVFCIQHFFLPFFFSHFQKDLFLRTDEPHTEKMNRPDCLVLCTHHWRQIFRRTQFPRRHLNKWQILRSGNVPTSFGAQLVLELLWKNLLWYGCSPSLMHKTSTSPLLNFIYGSLPCSTSCHTPSHRSQLTFFLLPCPSAPLKVQHVYTLTFLSRGHRGYCP